VSDERLTRLHKHSIRSA